MTPSDGNPVCPNAHTLRRVLRTAQLECHIRKVTSGRHRSYVRTAVDAPEDTAEKIAAAIRPLWMDGASRVRVLYRRLVIVSRAGWHRVHPDTPEGRATQAAKEQERAQQLLRAAETGRMLCVGRGGPDQFSRPVYQPTEDDPFRPWLVPHTGGRYASDQVHIDLHEQQG